MKITFLGAAHEVTGSCTLIEACGKKMLVDFGMEQGADIYENGDLPVFPGSVDFVFLTHAHIDHSGKLPLLYKNGFCGTIYATDATKKLCSIMLLDSAHIQEMEAVWRNRRSKRSGGGEYEPMYTSEDAVNTMKLFSGVGYGETIQISDGISAEFFDAGHLLGSSGVRISLTENGKTEKIVFSGDIGNKGRPLLCDPTMPGDADAVVIESTYGDRVHDGVASDREEQLASVIEQTLAKGGNLVIPSFAVGRTQELLYMIRHIKEKKAVKFDFPVWLDSPLAIEATNIYSGDMREYYDKEALDLLDKGINPIKFDGLKLSVTSDDSKRINFDETPKVIISASGMCEAGRIRHHLKYNLWRPESTVLFVGYQVPGTLGSKILGGAKFVTLFGEDIKVEARIEKLTAISAHADKNMLISWLSSMSEKPKRVFVNHGADGVCDSFAADVKNELGIDAVAPYPGDEYDIESFECIHHGNRRKINQSAAIKKRSSSAVWSKLYAAGMRLMHIIECSRDRKSRDLSELTARINAICDKQEKQIKHK